MLSVNHELVSVVARDLPEAWFLCLKGVLKHGYEYEIKSGSFVGQRRLEFNLITIEVEYPGTRPIIPDTPQGVPPPSSIDYVNEYLPYLWEDKKKTGEIYTYGEDIKPQLKPLIENLKAGSEGTNQACMSIGDKGSILLEHSQCLRVIDTRIRYGKLNFYVYFRSWDLWAGFPSNLAGIQLLKEYVASEVGVADGELFAMSKGLHLYDTTWELAKQVVYR